MRRRRALACGRVRSIAWALVAGLFASGCAYLLRSPDRPTPATLYRTVAGGRADCLLVLLPGMFDEAGEFARRGVVSDLHRSVPRCDLVAVETHLYDFGDESVVERVHEDVLEVARRRGYRHVWLVGVSMGALGAVLVAREHPSAIDGLLLVSPFLGTPRFAAQLEREIGAAGGLAAWAERDAQAPIRIARVLHDPRPIWRWLAGYARDRGARPLLRVAYARGDRFAPAQQLLAEIVPVDDRVIGDGTHAWPTWRILCEQLVADLPFDDLDGALGMPRQTPVRGDVRE